MKLDVTEQDFSIGSAEAWEPYELERLPENFLPIKQFSTISSSERIFLCGRRGTGKSAIAVMLERKATTDYRQAIQGEVDQYGAYMDVVKNLSKKIHEGVSIDIKSAIRRLWLWIFPLKAMQIIIKVAEENDKKYDDDHLAIINYLDKLPSPLHKDSRIGDLLAQTFETAVNLLDQGEEKFDSYLLSLTGSEAFRSAFKALSNIASEKKVLLIFDTLESYRIFQPYMVLGFHGILEALIALISDGRMKGISMKFFIPAEIYDEVLRIFPGKVQSKAVFLRWRSADLICMLARRYLTILKNTEAISRQEINRLNDAVLKAYKSQDGRFLKTEFWYNTKFLPQKIVNRRGVEEDCFAYMFRHTQRRPRDIIKQMQHIINESRKRNIFPYISPECVISGVHDPEVLLQILGDALTPYEGKIPGQLIANARTIFYQRKTIMTGRELKQFAQELYSLHPLEYVDPDVFLNLLLRCGVIGMVKNERPNNTMKELYCLGRFEYLIQGTLPMSDRFIYCIHPVLGDIFNLASVMERGVIYPMPESEEDIWLEDSAEIS